MEQQKIYTESFSFSNIKTSSDEYSKEYFTRKKQDSLETDEGSNTYKRGYERRSVECKI